MSIADLLGSSDATRLAELVASGDVSAEELTRASIERIEALNPTLNAVITPLFDRAIESARSGLATGPFHGVPTLLKDIGATMAGVDWFMGMRFLRRHGYRGPVNSYYTDKLQAAGFNILGKTNTPELGILPTTEPASFGATVNPYDHGRSTGGSSGGAAAAVASGMVPVAHANDGGGSIRIPASCCGLVGLKPSRGRLSAGPYAGAPAGGLSAELVVSRTVRDTAAVLDALAGPMPGDPFHAPPPARPFADEVGADPGRLRIGYVTDHIDTEGEMRRAHPDCVAAVETAARRLEGLGHHVEPRAIAALEEPDYSGHFIVIWAVNVHAALLALGGAVGEAVEESDVEPLTWALARMGASVTAGGYVNAWTWIEQNARRVASYFEDFDLYMSPTTAEPALPLGTLDDSEPGNALAAIFRAGDFAPFTPPFNATGQPGISLPLHATAAGLPVGVQLVSPYAGEATLLRVAAQLESEAPFLHPFASVDG